VPYEPFPIETDPLVLRQEAYDYIRSRYPEWEPSDANLDVIMIHVMSRMAAELRDVAANVPPYVFRRFGLEMLQLPAIEAAAARGAVQVTISHSDGYTVPPGTTFLLRDNLGEDQGFYAELETVIAPGANSGFVNIVAAVPGSAGNDINLGNLAQLADALADVSLVVLSTAPTGGTDAETVPEYENRLQEELKLLSPSPVVASDFATIAMRVPGVERALGIDLYNPDTDTFDNEKTVTVVVTDEDGEPLSAPVKADVKALLESYREVNFIIFVVDPDYTTVNVTYTVQPMPGYEVEVIASVNAALTEYFQPGKWGHTYVGGDYGSAQAGGVDWLYQTEINHYEVANVINDALGVDLVMALTINGSSAMTIPLSGATPLTRPGVMTGTVVLP
jgi:hypothetical protein